MTVEERNRKFMCREWYMDYLTGKRKHVSVTIDKNTRKERQLAQKALYDIIERNNSGEPEKASLDAVSDRLGHSISRVTKEIYLHVTKKKREEYNEMIRNARLLS